MFGIKNWKTGQRERSLSFILSRIHQLPAIFESIVISQEIVGGPEIFL